MTRVLVVNAGSSSLKLSLLHEGSDAPVAEQELEASDGKMNAGELDHALDGRLREADVVAHRIVHGGSRFREAVRVDTGVRAALGELAALAPLHQPKSLAALDAVSAVLSDLPAIACFDTAFHATLPPEAWTFALPERWRTQWGLRKYGFHGLSHAYISREVNVPRLISCHLGSGASLCAIAAGRSVDTTMGFTPLDGLVMATRSGSVDPGLLLWLLEQTGLTESEMASALEHDSGLLGLAGSADMRAVLAARDRGEERAALAIGVYLHHLRSSIAAMAASLGGVDVIAFTGGVGEASEAIRTETMRGLEFLGARQVVAIPAREDLEMARQARELLGATV